MKVLKNILVVDDEPMILEAIAALLSSRGYQVYTAETGQAALSIFDSQPISLIVLDLMLPDISGEEVCRAIRKQSRVPIIMLTAKADEVSQLEGLLGGADDYVTKPFSPAVLSARIEAVLRRSTDDLTPLVQQYRSSDDDLIVDFEHNTIHKAGVAAALTPTEMKLLSAFIKYPGRIFSRDALIALALGDAFTGYDRAVDSHIKNLRQKIETDPRYPTYILTVHGMGYKFGGD